MIKPLTILLVFLPSFLVAQSVQTLNADRLGYGINANNIDQGILQFEHYIFQKGTQQGVTTNYWGDGVDNIGFLKFFTDIRYGIIPKLEANISYNIGVTHDFFKSDTALPGETEIYLETLNDLDIGLRYNFLNHRDSRWAWSIQASITDLLEEGPNLKMFTSLEYKLFPNQMINLNVGFQSLEVRFRRLSYALKYSFLLGDEWCFYLENIGIGRILYLNANGLRSYYGGGFSYKPQGRNHMFDIRMAYARRLGERHTENFKGIMIQFGFSWRLHTRKLG